MNVPRTYPIAAHLQDFGRRPLSTVLLERDALAYGLKTHRVGATDFTAQDESRATIAFSRTGSALNARTSAPLTKNKHTTRLLLESVGAPAPKGRRFGSGDFTLASGYAAKIGFPVVFKPLAGMEGEGVVTNIRSVRDLEWAFKGIQGSRYASGDVLVEEHIEGETYRAIVINGEVVSVLISRRGSVRGDGQRTVGQLIDERQQMRRKNPHLLGRPIPVDDRTDHLLQRQGVQIGTVLASGAEIFFTFGSNTHQGGEPAQVIDDVHPTIIAACERASRAIPGLGFAGIDFIIPNISKPLSEQHAGICEINSVPAADSHEYPLYGRSVHVARRLLEATAKARSVRLSSVYAQRLSVVIYASGTIGDDYGTWLLNYAEKMDCKVERLSVKNGSISLRVQGGVDQVGIFVSLAFTGPPGTVIRSVISQPSA